MNPVEVLSWDLEAISGYLRVSPGMSAVVAGVVGVVFVLLAVTTWAASGRLQRPQWAMGVVGGAWGLHASLVVATVQWRRAVFVQQFGEVAYPKAIAAPLIVEYVHHLSALRLGLLVLVVVTALAASAVVVISHVLERKVELWRTFHPNKSFPGVVLVDAPEDTPMERVGPLLATMQDMGFRTVQLPFATNRAKVATKTLGTLERRRVCTAEVQLAPTGTKATAFDGWGQLVRGAVHRRGPVMRLAP